MSTILPDLQDEQPRPTSPSPWSTPRPDGPLAQALRRAEAQRSRIGASELDSEPVWDEPLPPELQPLPSPASPPPEAMAHDIEALAREARAHDGDREALAIALEWPADAAALDERRAMRSWFGWIALASALALAGVAAAIAVALAPRERAPARKPAAEILKLERQLSIPRSAQGAGAGP
jgi:hypothetical protein